MYKEELGGGARLLYNLNGKDWLLDDRKKVVGCTKKKELGSGYF